MTGQWRLVSDQALLVHCCLELPPCFKLRAVLPVGAFPGTEPGDLSAAEPYEVALILSAICTLGLMACHLL